MSFDTNKPGFTPSVKNDYMPLLKIRLTFGTQKPVSAIRSGPKMLCCMKRSSGMPDMTSSARPNT